MSDISIVLRRFKRTSEPKLELQNKGITYIPNDIYNIQQIEVLDLSNNKINSLDAKISQLQNLKILDLSQNQLIMLPQSLLQLPNLQVLKLDNNPLAMQFEVLKKSENQIKPRLQEALKVAFGLKQYMEECKDEPNVQQQQNVNQGNLMKDILGKDSEIFQLKKQNQELKQELSKLSLNNNNSTSALRISPQTPTVMEVDITDLEIGQQIAMGGFSTVHKGSFMGCPVAIKKIFNPSITQELLDELNNEINMLASLRHPRIVLLMCIVSKPPNLCIVTDYLPKGDLYSLLHKYRNREVTRQQKISIIKQVADVYLFMHKNKIVHRDLKSLNILLDDNLNIKVCDFGLARRFDEINTGNSKFSGTPTYMALELYQKKAYDHKVDVFAFGTLLWELFAREIPFDGLDPIDIMERIKNDTPLPYKSEVTSEVLDLVSRCRSVRPEKRPEFSEIVAEINTWF